jgi:simple sugar transport system ATP-binding protein
VSKRFGEKAALEGVTFGVAGGEVVGLVGENGAGKTTLLRILAGFADPDAGEVHLDGTPVRFRGPRDASARGIGLVHQHFLLVPELTVAEHAVLGREPGAGPLLDRAAAEDEVRACADRFGLALDPSAEVGSLGVAAQQRVELLKVLVRGASVLLLDEPTGLLPPADVRAFFALVRRLADEGRGVVLVTHKLREVTEVCDRAVVLRRGQVAGEVRWPAPHACPAAPCAHESELARLMVGEDLDLGRVGTRAARADGAPLLDVAGLTVAGVRGRPLVDGVSFSLRAGEIVGLAGVAENGQRELMEALAGVRPSSAERLSLGGEDLRPLGVAARRAHGLGYVPEDRLRDGLVADLTVAENLVLPATHRWARTLAGWLDRAGIRSAGVETVIRHGVRPPDPDAPVGSLSGGNQQKVLLARELRAAPRVLLAAEPARGLDFRAAEAVHGELRAAAERGGAVLVAGTDLAELLALCDRILVLCGGRIAGEVDPRRTSEDEIGLLMAGAKAAP